MSREIHIALSWPVCIIWVWIFNCRRKNLESRKAQTIFPETQLTGIDRRNDTCACPRCNGMLQVGLPYLGEISVQPRTI
jgi:hypothetical protein